MNIKTIGRAPSCDLMLDLAGVSTLHARLELCDDGRVYVVDADSGNHTFLNRNDQWIRLHKARLCAGDRIRFAQHEVLLPQLVDVFGKRAGVRLGEKHFSRRGRSSQTLNAIENVKNAAVMGKPMRNPLTGKIEQQAMEQLVEQPNEQTIEQSVEQKQQPAQQDPFKDV